MKKLIIVLILFVTVSCDNVGEGVAPDVNVEDSLDFVATKQEDRSFFEDPDLKLLIAKLKVSDDTNLTITVDSVSFAAVYLTDSCTYSLLIEKNSFIQEQTSITMGGEYKELDNEKDSTCLLPIWNKFL